METAQQYQSEVRPARKDTVYVAISSDTVYAAISSISCGLEYARVRLEVNDFNIGRTTQGDIMYAETLERHIQQMEAALKELRECGPANR